MGHLRNASTWELFAWGTVMAMALFCAAYALGGIVGIFLGTAKAMYRKFGGDDADTS